MRTQSSTFTAALLIASLAAPALVLAAVNFKVDPIITADGTQLSLFAKLTGLGNIPLDVAFTADVEVETTCENKGENIAPGQTKSFTRDKNFTIFPDKHGNATIDESTDPVTIQELGKVCPNNSWTAAIGTTTFSNVTLVIKHDGVIVFECGVSGSSACVVST